MWADKITLVLRHFRHDNRSPSVFSFESLFNLCCFHHSSFQLYRYNTWYVDYSMVYNDEENHPALHFASSWNLNLLECIILVHTVVSFQQNTRNDIKIPVVMVCFKYLKILFQYLNTSVACMLAVCLWFFQSMTLWAHWEPPETEPSNRHISSLLLSCFSSHTLNCEFSTSLYILCGVHQLHHTGFFLAQNWPLGVVFAGSACSVRGNNSW